jgi:HD-GYP domain-containing protein (c-di-GMP phosphodiesterase class II)
MTILANDSNLNIIENIISASADADFYLTEDVYDIEGNKLLGKGYKITPVIKEKLINRVLKKSLETSITSSSSITADDIHNETQALIKNTLFLQHFNPELKLHLSALKYLELAPLASLLLTIQKHNCKEAFEHSLFMMLIARLIAKKLKYDTSQIYDLTIACLLHDIGELYCVLPDTKNISLENWRSIMTHPIIGSSVVSQHMHYSASVSQAILEHHERNDGSGYPNHLLAENSSEIGKVLIVAEAFSGMVRRKYEINNLITTLKLVNHDFPSSQHSALIDLLYSVKSGGGLKAEHPILDHLLAQLLNIEEIIKLLQSLTSSNPKLEELSEYLILRLSRICQTIYASGFTNTIDLSMLEQIRLDDDMNNELFITINELEWKVKDVFRDISLWVIKQDLQNSDELLNIIQKIEGREQTLLST